MIFDTHAHYTDEQFANDLQQLLTSMHNDSNVSEIITCGTDIQSSIECISLSERYPFVYAAAGYHPEELTRTSVDINKLKKLISNEKVVAIGEIGLDYYWNKENKQKQKEGFIAQLNLAKEFNLPVIVHDRDAHGDTLEILKHHKSKGVVHCFSGSVEMATDIVKLGMYIGVGGVITFKNAKNLPEVIDATPIEKILLETDSPYLSPEPFRGKRNDSSLIIYIAEKISNIKGISKEKILKITRENAYQLFLNNK